MILDGTITFNDATVQSSSSNTYGNLYGIGNSQTWQDVTASRVVGTTYTNSTGRAIFVAVASINPAAGTTSSWQITVNSVGVANSGDQSNRRSSASTIVPNGSTYSVSMQSDSVQTWSELR